MFVLKQKCLDLHVEFVAPDRGFLIQADRLKLIRCKVFFGDKKDSVTPVCTDVSRAPLLGFWLHHKTGSRFCLAVNYVQDFFLLLFLFFNVKIKRLHRETNYIITKNL